MVKAIEKKTNKASKKAEAPKAFYQTKEFKNAFRFTAKPKSLRPMLEGVHILEDRSLIATDSYHLIKIDAKLFGAKKGCTYDKNGNEIENGTYPKVGQIIDMAEKKIKHTFQVDVKEWLGAHDLLNVLASEQNTDSAWTTGKRKGICLHRVTVLTKGGSLKLQATDGNGNSGKYILQEKVKKAVSLNITYNATYMLDALKAFKDLGFTKVEVSFGADQTDIIVLKAEGMTALVLPIRAN